MPIAFGDGHGVGNPGEGAQGREPTGGTQGRETVLAKYVLANHSWDSNSLRLLRYHSLPVA